MNRGNTKKKNDMVFLLFSLVLGMLMGWLAKDLSGQGIVGAIIANIGIWVFVSSLLAAYTPQAVRAAVHVFVYYVGVLGAYYAHVALIGGEVKTNQLLYGVIFAAMGALIGFIVWHGSGKEWLGAGCAAVPIALILGEGYPIYHSRSISLAMDLAFALILYLLLVRGKNKKLMCLPFILVFTFVLVYFNVFERIFGGWI